MNPIKVMFSFLSGRIEAGRVDPVSNMFKGARDDVTDSVYSAVASALLYNECAYQYEIKGKTYVLQLKEVKNDETD